MHITNQLNMLARVILALTLTLCLCTSQCWASDLILPPVKQGSAEVALVWIQGASVVPSAYQTLVQQIQQDSPFTLWVAVPEFALDIPEPLVLSGGISRVLQNMTAQGMNASAVFFAGHSLGGAMIQDYVNSNAASMPIAGQILMGAFLNRKYRNTAYPVPTLTVGGELDGLCRVTRIAEAYFVQVQNASDFNQAVQNMPVVVVTGANHWSFASGTPPAFVQSNDLRAEISSDAAHETIAQVITDFMGIQMGDGSGLNDLTKMVQTSGQFLAPIVSALQLEGFYHFKPPCYDNPQTSSCLYGNPWTEKAQVMMGGVNNATLLVTDAFHPVDQINPVHLPNVWNNCTGYQSQCVLNVTTVTENVYDLLDGLDTGFSHISASEMRAKMKSRQAVMEAAGFGNVDFNVTDAPNICSQINQQSYQWAVDNSASNTISRFQQYGLPMIMGNDLGPYNAGPLWIWTSMSYTNSSNGLVVQAPMMKTPIPYFISFSAGFHYCKLLSPARAVEWIYIDSLRANYHI